MKTMFLSFDGKIFQGRRECLEYERLYDREAKIANINRVKHKLPNVFNSYVKCKKEFNEALNDKHDFEHLKILAEKLNKLLRVWHKLTDYQDFIKKTRIEIDNLKNGRVD